jgi:hypothetical protein
MSDVMVVRGLDELRVIYRTLPDKMKRGVVRRSVGAGASLVARALRKAVPVHQGPYKNQPSRRPGRMRRSVVYKQARELNTATQVGFVVTILRGKKYQRLGKNKNINKDAYYWPWVDAGHLIVPSRRSNKYGKHGIAWRRRIGKAEGRRVPGVGFMDAVLKSSTQPAIEEVAAKMRADLGDIRKRFVE